MDLIKETLEKAKKDGIKFVMLQFTDLHGVLKSVTIPAHKLPESLEKGTWFDGSSIEGFTRIAESDMFLKPDPATYALVPWEQGTARVICDVYTPDGKPFEGDPRYILKKMLAIAEKEGYIYNVGPELEFFLFKPREDGQIVPVTHDKAGYFDFPARDLATQVRNDIVIALESMGLEVEMSHHEVAPGQHEIDFKYGYALTQADRALTFKYVVKSIAQKYGIYASFMPKPLFGVNGSGMHVHQSLFDSEGNNIFFNANDNYKLSALAKSFIAGQLSHIKAMSAITAPTVNSYKRLVPGYEAPILLAYSECNRSASIRIPYTSQDKSRRIEVRFPDAIANPYLAFTAMMMAGIDGIKNKIDPGKSTDKNLYNLSARELSKIPKISKSLEEATISLQKDHNFLLAGDIFSEKLIQTLIEMRFEEIEKMRSLVHPFEYEMYYSD